MSLSDIQITELCAQFRRGAQRAEEEAPRSADIERVVLLAAMTTALRWVTTELEGYAGGTTARPPTLPTGEPEDSEAPQSPGLGRDEESP